MHHHEHRDGHGNPTDLQQYIARLDDPGRDEWQRPDAVLDLLGLTANTVVCEIGPGSGYFTLRLAQRAGHVHAVDVEPQLLALLRDRVGQAGVTNVTPILALPADPLVAPSSCDVVVTVNTLHHVPALASYLRRLRATLRPGGRLVVIDFHNRETPVGPPVDHRMAREVLLEHARSAGLQPSAEHDVLPYQYFVVLQTNER